MNFSPVLFLLFVVFALLLLACARKTPDFNEETWKKQVDATDSAMLYAEHTKPDGTFFNPWLEQNRIGNLFAFFTREKATFPEYPKEKYTPKENTYSYLKDSADESISFAGHASFIIKMNGQTILIDPFFSGRALVKAAEVNIHFDFDRLPDRPVVLISHNHYDHLDKYSIKKLIEKDALFLVPLHLKKYLYSLGAEKVHELDWWENITIDNVTYIFLPAQHWSRRIGQERNTTLWGGYLIDGGKKIYFSGDTGYFKGFAEIGKKFPGIDYALVTAGAYRPRWFMHYFHQNIEEFLRASDDLQAKVTIPMHFGVIRLGDEPITYPVYEIEQHIEKQPEYQSRIKILLVGDYLTMQEEGAHE